MVAANLAAARFLRRHKMPTLYRVHPAPTPEKLSELRTFLGELALRLGGGDEPQARHYSALLRRVSERADAHLIETVLLRSLAQALYSPNTAGHFGLALAHYVHFTSPIRRYPDLIVHRAICHVLKGGGADEFAYSWDDLLIQGDQCSMTERRADEATRDAINWLKCEFVMSRVGEIFRGTVAAVTSFGLFVELDDVYVEGLLHVTALGNDYYHFDPVHHRLQGERTGKAYRIGDRLTVRVVRVNLDERKVDLEFPAQQNAPHPKPKRRVRRR
jgi:ribonuclease R